MRIHTRDNKGDALLKNGEESDNAETTTEEREQTTQSGKLKREMVHSRISKGCDGREASSGDSVHIVRGGGGGDQETRMWEHAGPRGTTLKRESERGRERDNGKTAHERYEENTQERMRGYMAPERANQRWEYTRG